MNDETMVIGINAQADVRGYPFDEYVYDATIEVVSQNYSTLDFKVAAESLEDEFGKTFKRFLMIRSVEVNGEHVPHLYLDQTRETILGV